jgi:hypothetical protein
VIREYFDLHVCSCGRLQIVPARDSSGDVVALLTTEDGAHEWWLTRQEARDLIANLSAAVRRAELEDTPGVKSGSNRVANRG